MSDSPLAPAWMRFHEMTQQVNEMLIGAAQCRNHLSAILDQPWLCEDPDLRHAIAEALERLTRVGI